MDKYPIIKRVDYTEDNNETINELRNMSIDPNIDVDKRDLLFNYPVVYVIYSSDPKKKGNYIAYAGETINIIQRTKQHLKDDSKKRSDWKHFNYQNNSKYLCIIGDKYFSKSMTLDIENQLITYLINDPKVSNGIDDGLYSKADRENFNRRGNNQNLYYGYSKVNQIFYLIWNQLNKDINDNLFVSYNSLKRSVLNGAFYLTPKQLISLNDIYRKIMKHLWDKKSNSNTLLFIKGGAGTGKTVLLNHLFYDCQRNKHITCRLVVNQNQQLKNYYDKFSLLGLDSRLSKYHTPEELISKPEHFVNHQEKSGNKVDVLLVDEAHLLYTQYNQGHSKHHAKDQLNDLRKYSLVTVVVFDPDQILRLDEYNKRLLSLMNDDDKNTVKLKYPLRIRASHKMIDWIDDFAGSSSEKRTGVIKPIPNNDKYNYKLKIYNDPIKMMNDIKNINKKTKAKYDHSNGNIKNPGLCRMVATYDWRYKSPTKANHFKKFYVYFKFNKNGKSHQFKVEWNGELQNKKVWLDQSQTLNQIGSVYTVQGFDLNYVGLIIGPSVIYRDGKVKYDYTKNCDKHIRHDKKFRDLIKDPDVMKSIQDDLVQNQLSTLLKRGVHGLFIYACDPQLRHKLEKQYRS